MTDELVWKKKKKKKMTHQGSWEENTKKKSKRGQKRPPQEIKKWEPILTMKTTPQSSAQRTALTKIKSAARREAESAGWIDMHETVGVENTAAAPHHSTHPASEGEGAGKNEWGRTEDRKGISKISASVNPSPKKKRKKVLNLSEEVYFRHGKGYKTGKCLTVTTSHQ